MRTMMSLLEHEEQFWSDFDPGSLGGVKIDYENGVFRRYHAEDNPVSLCLSGLLCNIYLCVLCGQVLIL